MNARALLDSLLERQELGKIAGLEQRAKEMLAEVEARWKALYQQAFVDALPSGRGKAVQAARARLRDPKAWSVLPFPAQGLTLVLSCGDGGSKMGEFRHGEDGTTYIDLVSPGFNFQYGLAQMAAIRPANPAHKDTRWILRQAREGFDDALRALKSAPVLNTLFHELVHHQDDRRYPLVPALDRQNARLTARLSRNKPGLSAQLRLRDETYMGSTHEYNAYTLASLHAALGKKGKTWDGFWRAFLEAYGSSHWALTPLPSRRKAAQRAYAAFTQQQPAPALSR